MATNTSAALAMALSPIPFAVAQAVTAGTDLWYSFTPAAGEQWIGFWAFGSLTGYSPVTWVYTGSPSSLTPYLGFGGQWATNKAMQVPVTAGTTYYFKVVSPTDGTATVQVVRGPHLTAPAGSLFIPDDTNGYPAIILDQHTGQTLRAIHPFPPGEAGDVLADGTIAVENDADNRIDIYGPDLALVTTVAHNVGTLAGSIRALKSAGVFYAVTSATPAVLHRIEADGTITDSWTLHAAAKSIAVSEDEETAYYTSGSTGIIYTWDLIGDAQGADFASEPGRVMFDILTWPNGDVVASFVDTSPVVVEVRRYSAAGVLLKTYDFGTDHGFPVGTLPRLSYALGAEEFWLWTHLASVEGMSRFFRVDLESGEILTQFDVPEYEGGAANGDETNAPAARFGISFSCPLLTLRAPIVTMMVDESVPCCGDSSGGDCGACPPSPITTPTGSPASGPIPTSTGPITEPVNIIPETGSAPTPLDPPYWERLCTGAGTVPSDADPVDAESWVRH